MKIYNTLSRQLEEFVPLEPGIVTLYTCGPTVYHYAHIGNLRSFLTWDVLKRTLIQDGYEVKHVMNITDVGHLTDDADAGEDKMEKGARREGKSVWDIARFYTDAYLDDVKALNILPPTMQPKATEYIQQQIDLITVLEEKGYTYKTSSGIAYDTSKFPDYNKLSRMNLDELQEGARVEADSEKRHVTDFYLWKFSKPDEIRQMEWDSPWGKGFPGWHVECSAMAINLLGETIDIHCGGIDHIPVHHTNEIAQSEAATGKLFSRYWMHNNFLTLSGGSKMAKSGDNFFTLQKIVDLGFEPLVYRYMVLTAHYRSELEFSIESLQQAKITLENIRNFLHDHEGFSPVDVQSNNYYLDFMSALNDDLNTPQALAVLHTIMKSDLSEEVKISLLLSFDSILGLRLAEELEKSSFVDPSSIEIDGKSLQILLNEREAARAAKNWVKADAIRDLISQHGFLLEDTKDGQKARKAF